MVAPKEDTSSLRLKRMTLDEAREYVEAEDEWAMSMRDYEK